MDGVLLANAVENMPERRFQRLERRVCFGAQPFVLDFSPERFNSVQMGAIGRQVEHLYVLLFPSRESGLESRGMVNPRAVEHQHGGPGAGGDLGLERVDNESGIQPAFAGGGVQLVGRGIIES